MERVESVRPKQSSVTVVAGVVDGWYEEGGLCCSSCIDGSVLSRNEGLRSMELPYVTVPFGLCMLPVAVPGGGHTGSGRRCRCSTVVVLGKTAIKTLPSCRPSGRHSLDSERHRRTQLLTAGLGG